MEGQEKKGQVTIFVVVAIFIVGLIVLIFFFPTTLNITEEEVNPGTVLRNCISQPLNEIKTTLSEQGGSAKPENYALYQDQKIQYLCYTTENYKPCVVQQPLLIKHAEQEIQNYIQPRARECVEQLRQEYEKQGYNVRTTPGKINVSIEAGSINIEFLSPLTIEKESTQTFRKFAISQKSEWYDLLAIATNILQYESTLGDSETNLYLQYYPNLRIDKTRRDEGTTIYKLTEVTTNDEFTFATRSLVWPQGLS